MTTRFHLPSLLLATNIFATSVLLISQASCQPHGETKNPVEVGKVIWGRDYESALASAKQSGKPIFLLFQEVPGCAGCKQFGREVLSDDKVVKTIQDQFTPLLIHNNKPGKDAEVLEKFNEPAWNYQVVRFLDADGRDLIPRKDKVWDSAALMERMKQALAKAGPKKVKTVDLKQVAIAQHCFWTGEMKIGAMEGVVRTESGFLNGNEVTLVDYDPGKISLENLTRNAKAAGVANRVFESLDGYQKAPDSDQKRQLKGTKYAKLQLSPEQATKVNAFARTDPTRADSYARGNQR
ncbi:MAG: VPGUxxT family thioredoxin-like (seleno)protein, type 2 [Luteolibacter sp.]